ncbi:uncharacterized protein LOC106050512 isoform X1 [Biomphalaria glabrata]|uniref:Uncharacterized protein LOC106050512 isoform X1 n=1 Tax=Biomphalaria glabrata TaxID=6526 RepID=A0A9W3ARP4_BIOGL|nr:uncharacterized protein LOC106050512 isoform X1 [Biomphalaria glabrata]
MEPEPCLIFTEQVKYYDNPMEWPALQPIPYNVQSGQLTWQWLESGRLRRLGIPHRESKHCNIVYNSQVASLNKVMNQKPTDRPPCIDDLMVNTKRWTTNSLAPFYTHQKRICGYFFSRDTDHRLHKHGIPPSDLVAWRSTYGSK